jgi:outer membrane protein OmpA-like peptidoglycan-associated protein/outer membrane protein assembly factor BamD (BamD/ComL family)
MKTFITLTLISFFAFCASGQNMVAEEFYKKGKDLYDNDKYEDAIVPLKRATQLSKEYPDALYHLGLCYKYMNKLEDALEQFNKLNQVDPNYWGWYWYEAGDASFQLAKYDDAITWYDKFLEKYPTTPTRVHFHHWARYQREKALRIKDLNNEKVSMKEPVMFPSNVNSAQDDYMPNSDPTGRTLYFTSKRLGGTANEAAGAKDGDEDIYQLNLVDGKWSDPLLLPRPINSENHEGASTFSADGQTIVYTACGREGGVGSCDLYIMHLEGSQWSEPVNLGDVVNTKEWDSQPTISSDGSRIIFCSARPGGYGSEDLYMIEKNVFGEWGPAQNLGGMVNTPFSDASPYLSPDGKTLYFASVGHPGFGSYDLFKTVYDNGKWSSPVNMVKPLNTSGNDQYFTIGGSGEIGYLASNRGQDGLKLYSVEIPEDMRPTPTVIVSGVVSNAKNGDKVGAYFIVEDLNSGELIAVNKSNSVTGKYLVVLPAGRNYSVSANKEAFLFFSQSFEVSDNARYQEIKKDIALKPIEKGAKVVLNNIFFETGKAALSQLSTLELEKAIDLMKKNPTMVIEVGGHTDNVGEDAINMKLSAERAKSVRDYLVKGGIPTVRIQAKGYGESSPVAGNDTDEGRKTNRRTEFIILEF